METDMDLQAGSRGMSALEIIEQYPEYAQAAALTLGITVDELRKGLEGPEKVALPANHTVESLAEEINTKALELQSRKRHLPIIGDPNEPNGVERKLLQIQEPREAQFNLDTPIGEGATSLDWYKFRAEKAEAKITEQQLLIDQLEYDLRKVRLNLTTLHQTVKGTMHFVEVVRGFIDRNSAEDQDLSAEPAE